MYLTPSVAVTAQPDLALQRPPVLQDVFALFASAGVQAVVYGGYWRDFLLLGHNQATPDVDVAMSIHDWGSLPLMFRRNFRVTGPHKRYVGAMRKYHGRCPYLLPQILVLESTPELTARMETSVGVTLKWARPNPLDLITDCDLGFSQIADDGTQVWVSQAFLTDCLQQTMTVTRCKDPRDATRTNHRMFRFAQGRYTGWKPVVPEHFWPHWYVCA